MSPSSAPPKCPRCRGRLHLTGDRYGRYLSCLTCGFVHELVSGQPLALPTRATYSA